MAGVASDAHISILRQGARAWNAWRREASDITPDLRELRLPPGLAPAMLASDGPLNFSDADLTGADLSHAILPEANFARAQLAHVDFSQAKLRAARFDDADLTGAFFGGAEITNATFGGAVVDDADMRGTIGLTAEALRHVSGSPGTKLPAHIFLPEEWLASEGDFRPAPSAPSADDDTRIAEDAEEDDLYMRLGLPFDATPEQLRAAFLQRAKRLHPDLHQGDARAEHRFKRINAAFALLKDEARRRRYDHGLIDSEGNERGAQVYGERAATAEKRVRFAASAGLVGLLIGGVAAWYVVTRHTGAVRQDSGAPAVQVTAGKPAATAPADPPLSPPAPAPAPEPAPELAAAGPAAEPADTTTTIAADANDDGDAWRAGAAASLESLFRLPSTITVDLASLPEASAPAAAPAPPPAAPTVTLDAPDLGPIPNYTPRQGFEPPDDKGSDLLGKQWRALDPAANAERDRKDPEEPATTLPAERDSVRIPIDTKAARDAISDLLSRQR